MKRDMSNQQPQYSGVTLLDLEFEKRRADMNEQHVANLQRDYAALNGELVELRSAILDHLNTTDTPYALRHHPTEDRDYQPTFLRLLKALRATSRNPDINPSMAASDADSLGLERMFMRVCRECFNLDDTISNEPYDDYVIRQVGRLKRRIAELERGADTDRQQILHSAVAYDGISNELKLARDQINAMEVLLRENGISPLDGARIPPMTFNTAHAEDAMGWVMAAKKLDARCDPDESACNCNYAPTHLSTCPCNKLTNGYRD